jgi:hypothetical protein
LARKRGQASMEGLIDMMNRNSPHQDKGQQREPSQPEATIRPEESVMTPRKPNPGTRRPRHHDADKAGFDEPAWLIPAARRLNLTAVLREDRLQVELLLQTALAHRHRPTRQEMPFTGSPPATPHSCRAGKAARAQAKTVTGVTKSEPPIPHRDSMR